jgi:hypothetical protein
MNQSADLAMTVAMGMSLRYTDRMRTAEVRIAVAVVAAICGCAGPVGAQNGMSFNPTTPGACEKALGHASLSDAVSDARSYELQCADADLQREKAEFAQVEQREEQATPAERAAWRNLESAFEKFKRLHLKVFAQDCGGGNGCGADGDQAEAHANYQFLLMAEGFRGREVPVYNSKQAAADDAKLNRDYDRAIAAAPGDCGNQDGCVARGTLREMERAWIQYRDAWVAFGAVRWPLVSADSWRESITLQRIAMGGDGGGE